MADATITLWSDHLPLKRFLQKTALNAKVNNWRVELSDYDIKFKYIKGIKNTLLNTLSRLVDLDITELNLPEKEGYEYGCAIFEQLPGVYVDGSKHELTPWVDVSNINGTIMKDTKKINCHLVQKNWLIPEMMTFYYVEVDKW